MAEPFVDGLALALARGARLLGGVSQGVRFATAGRLLGITLLGLGTAACIARSDDPLRPITSDDDDTPHLVDAGSEEPITNLPPADPHAVLGVEPPQGPFSGGRTALVRGNGFTTSVRVWFGDVEVPQEDVTPVDANRVQVVTPPGDAGLVDVTARNGDDESTQRTLAQAYQYDPFEVAPTTGPTSGGTEIEIVGQGTSFGEDTEVLIGSEPCASLEVSSPTQLVCVTPPSPPGARSIRIDTGAESLTVLDAFTYGDSSNGFRGGLSGTALEEELKVLVLDNYTGSVVPNATVILDDDLSSATPTDAAGIALFNDDELGPSRTITVAAHCFQPMTFVDVRVDTLTAYLDPVITPACGELGELPASGSASSSSTGGPPKIRGELFWQPSGEFKREGWTNVPPPSYEGERRVAYVMRSSGSATSRFRLPSEGSAVTPESDGLTGFEFEMEVAPGTYTLYALAGIENRERDPITFTAYSMGVVQGVSAGVGSESTEVFIRVDIPLDHALSVDVTGPTPTPRGPDRLVTQTAVRLAQSEYLLFPIGERTTALPTTEPLEFIGLPPLGGALRRAQYVVSTRAVTGQNEGDPSSSVGLFASSAERLTVEGFVEVPRLVSPETGALWDGQSIAVAWPAGGPPVSLTVVEVQSGGGLINWTIALPEGAQEVALPNLAELADEVGLLPGPITFVVSAAHISTFDYGSLRYRQLGTSGWDAYARDSFYARY